MRLRGPWPGRGGGGARRGRPPPEADVRCGVAGDFVARVREAAAGQEIWKSLSPAQQVIKIVHDELTHLLGGAHRELRFAPRPPPGVMLVGLHGTGKTTSAAKL